MKPHTVTLIIGVFLASAAMIVYPVDHRKEAGYAGTTSKNHNTVAYNTFKYPIKNNNELGIMITESMK